MPHVRHLDAHESRLAAFHLIGRRAAQDIAVRAAHEQDGAAERRERVPPDLRGRLHHLSRRRGRPSAGGVPLSGPAAPSLPRGPAKPPPPPRARPPPPPRTPA